MNRFKAAAPYVVPLLMAAFFLITSPISAWAMHLGTVAGGHPPPGLYVAEDVRNTIHNLGDSIAGFDNPNILPTAANTNEVCVFCHTPHGANTNVAALGGSAPLWNRELPTSVYTTYNSPNFDTGPPLRQPQGVSLACLSCHDGTIALDALVNVGGSGGFQGYTPPSGDLVNPQGASLLIDGGGSMTETLRTDTGANYEEILGGASPFPNLGIDLTDDHPISMHIPNGNGGCAGFVAGPAGDDPQFDELCTNSTALAGSILLLGRSAVDGPSDRRDALRAYPDPADNLIASNTFIECASCHNPHTPRPLFLRLPSGTGVGVGINGETAIPAVWSGAGEKWGDNPNKGSAICLSCHEK